jgi:hypothetical protein
MRSPKGRLAYQAVQDLVASIGGQMEWVAGGTGGGGTWKITLPNKSMRPFRVADNRVNDLDHLYRARVVTPATWDDFHDELVAEPTARLLALLK